MDTLSACVTPSCQKRSGLTTGLLRYFRHAVLVALRGVGGNAFVEYVEDVYQRLPNVKKRLVEVDGSVYWMLSHPKDAAQVIGEWFDETLS